jgi:methanethiol S-methyltransferase
MAGSGWGTKGVALLCYLAAQAGSAALLVWIFYQGLGYALPMATLPPPWPWLIDSGLLLLFGLQHSGMARAGFKRVWTRILPGRLERSVYAAASGLVVIGMLLFWQSLGDAILWRLPAWVIVVPLLACLGVALMNTCFDHAGLFGLRQAWAGTASDVGDTLILRGPYRVVRHPLMACLLLLLWTQPVLSLNLAVFNTGMTLYIAVGVLLEERDLTRRFDPAYTDYRLRVPALIPWRWSWWFPGAPPPLEKPR